MLFRILAPVFLTLNLNASNIKSVEIDLSGSETKLNLCLLEAVKKVISPEANQKVKETGFAFSGSFVTHPLFNSVPVLFISYQEDVEGSPNEVRVIRDVHLAIPSLQRNGWSLNTQRNSVSSAVTGLAYISIIENPEDLFKSPMQIEISDCL